MELVRFTIEEKAEMFDEIADLFYKANFGRASKSDIELKMFDFYIRKVISSYQNVDGTIDYSKCSDYKISKDLGITQQRVRNLKIKNQLINPVEYDWKAAFANLTKNARYDVCTRKITINIPDPNLFYEIQNFIEEQGGYVEMQLNSKIFQIRAEYYIELAISLEPEKSHKEVIKAIRYVLKKSNKNNYIFDEKHIGRFLIESAVDITEVAKSISPIWSPINVIGKALTNLLT